MTDELPFRAEYAKSGRSSCKGCQKSIAQNTLRLAVMVQSPKFDAKIPNWYHHTCFFTKCKSKIVETSQISHFDSLRWDDQQKIKKQVASKTASESDGSNGKFVVEYAKSSRSTCKSCMVIINKGEIRVGIEQLDDERAIQYGAYLAYYHLECFAEHRSKVGFTQSGKDLTYFKKLKAADQSMVSELIVGSKKRKNESNVQKKVPMKKTKEEAAEEKAIKEQNKIMFGYIDKLKKHLKKAQMIELLKYNNQNIPKGINEIQEILADVMTFGALEQCSECNNGTIYYKNGTYKCSGSISDWTRCQFSTREPTRFQFEVPEDMDHPFLQEYKCEKRTRILPKLIAPPAVKNEEVSESSQGKSLSMQLPLSSLKFVILGPLKSMKIDKATEFIKSKGGSVLKRRYLNEKVVALIIDKGKLESESRTFVDALLSAESHKVCVLSEDFFELIEKGEDVLAAIGQCTISSHQSEAAKIVEATKQRFSGEKKSIYEKNIPDKMKMMVKGGAVVEPDSGLQDIAHVYEDRQCIYSVVLVNVDVQTGANSYYKLQILRKDHDHSMYWLFRSWGRLGTTIGSNKIEKCHNLPEVLDLFEECYALKTGVDWNDPDRKNRKVIGKLYPIDVEFGQADDDLKKLNSSESKSKLAKAIQDLLCLIFDVERMNEAMLEYEIDVKKMPLGKLSKKQIQNAYTVLTNVLQAIKDGSNANKILDFSNRFYSLIPHDFGMKKPPLLDSEEFIKKKIEMLDNLLDIEIAYSVMNCKNSDGEGADQMDDYYSKLKADIEVIDKSSEEFNMIKKYVKNTHAATHSHYDLVVSEAFKLDRHGEEKRFKKFKNMQNRMLLWHGSRISNYAGIISQGLRIAPPEAPVTGYMFGKGIYFADMVSKSANYCWTSKSQPTGLMLLCEIALGDMYELKNSKYIDKLPKGKHSTKGCGMTAPNPKKFQTTEDGVTVPLGKPTKTNSYSSALLYNEYIVYDTAQVRMKYLLKMDFKYKY